LYQFGNSFILTKNEFIRDSAIRFAPDYFKYPYQPRKIFLYGPTLECLIGTKQQELLLASKSPNKGYALKGHLIDSSDLAVSLFDLHSLQISVSKNQEADQSWTNVMTLQEINSPSFLRKGYGIHIDSLAIGDRVTISFRNAIQKKELIKFDFERKDPFPLRPFLATLRHDSSVNHSYSYFIENSLAEKEEQTESIDSFYRYWPASGDRMLRNDHYYPHSKLALFFRKPSPDYPDESLEYSLLTGPIKDTVWKSTNHILFLPELSAGRRYSLLVRYKTNPGFVQRYSFYTDPYWYQTGWAKILFGSLAAIILLLTVLFIYMTRLKNIRKKRQQLSLEIKSIRSQLNPHFVFNALASIQGLINKNDIAGANHYLTEFSNLLRESLQSTNKEMTPLFSEITLLDTYLKLEQLRFHFQYSITIDDSIDQNAVEIPSLLLQPLVENAVKHGVASLQEKGIIAIRFTEVNNHLEISLTDNGSGFNGKQSQNGLGLKLTQDRIHLLNHSSKKQKIEILFKCNQHTGTTVHLIFQNWL
jgi:two-component sensor histidine kinase